MKKSLVLLSVFAVTLLVACGRGDFHEEAEFEDNEYATDMLASAPSPTFKPERKAAEPAGYATFDAGVIQRKVIYNATLRVEVADFQAAARSVHQIAEHLGGFISNSRTEQADRSGRLEGEISVRVPQEKFRDALKQLGALGRVELEDIHGKDVTEEYTDLEARLHNAKKLEERLLSLLAEKGARLKDMLAVEVELGRVREEIERHEGRKRFLDDRLTLASITIELFEPYTYSKSVFDPLGRAFDRFGKLFFASVASLMTFFAVAIPWVIVVSGLGYLVVWFVIRQWRRRR